MSDEKAAAQGTVDIRPLHAITADAERQAYEKRRSTVIAKEEEKKTLCWYGTLPGPKTAQMWGESMAWQGKCEHYQNLNVAGIEFEAFHEKLVRSTPNESVKGDTLPGNVRHFTESQLSKIKTEAFKVFYRKISEKQGYVKKEGQVDYEPDPRDMPLAHYIYLVPIKSAAEVPSLEAFFQTPPKSLAG